MEKREIYSEQPELEQWQLLEIYSYPNNICKYFKNNNMDEPSEEKIEYITNSILQAKEYFFLAQNATLYTQPVLVYYGYINLLSATYVLKNGEIPNVQNHGMAIIKSGNSIGEIKIHLNNEKSGALAIFANLLDTSLDIKKLKDLRINELFSVIPETLDYYIMSYANNPIHVIPVDEVIHKKYKEDRIKNYYIKLLKDSIESLRNSKYIKNNYLPIQYSENSEYTFLRRKITYSEEYVYCVNHKKYINIPFEQKNDELKIDSKISMLIILYELSVLCRYNPSIWNKFIKLDSSGEKLLIQSFINWCIRLIPNYILNIIENADIVFSTREQGTINKKDDENELNDVIKKEVEKYLKERRQF